MNKETSANVQVIFLAIYDLSKMTNFLLISPSEIKDFRASPQILCSTENFSLDSSEDSFAVIEIAPKIPILGR